MNETTPSVPAARPRERPPTPSGAVDGVLHWARWIRRLLIGCIGFEVLWIILDQTISIYGWIDDTDVQELFHLSMEENAPTWFASTQATFVGLTIFAIYFVTRAQGAPRGTRRGWLTLGFFFAYLGLDDTAKVHERLGSVVGDLFEAQIVPIRGLLGIDTYDWQLFLAPLFALMGLFMLVFLWRHFGRYALRTYLVLGLACYAVAVSIDFLEGTGTFFFNLGEAVSMDEDFVRHNFKVTEEILEMFGTTMFWQGFLHFLARISDGFRLRLTRV